MEFQTIGVLGTGQMGAGIAQVAAEAGLRVLMADLNREIAEKGKAGIARLLGKAVEKGKLDAARRDAVLARLEPQDSVAAVPGRGRAGAGGAPANRV
jgi:3-hydroxybutyryl-CoA dehydrogenase